MENVTYAVTGDKLVLTIDCSRKAMDMAPPSSTGKTYLLASSRGQHALEKPIAGRIVSIQLNVTLKPAGR